MTSVLTVNYNCDDFLRVLINTAGRKTPIIVSENSKNPRYFSGAASFINPGEKTHGEGLNFGLGRVETPHVLILDVDCHFLCGDWLESFVLASKTHDVVTVAGPPQKPLRPACVYLKAEYARRLDWRATSGYLGHRVTPDGFDVGIRAYHQMVRDGLKVKFMDVVKPSRYGTLNGEEYGLEETPLIYHHWHSAHDRSFDYPGHDLKADRKKVLDHFRVKTFL